MFIFLSLGIFRSEKIARTDELLDELNAKNLSKS